MCEFIENYTCDLDECIKIMDDVVELYIKKYPYIPKANEVKQYIKDLDERVMSELSICVMIAESRRMKDEFLVYLSLFIYGILIFKKDRSVLRLMCAGVRESNNLNMMICNNNILN